MGGWKAISLETGPVRRQICFIIHSNMIRYKVVVAFHTYSSALCEALVGDAADVHSGVEALPG